MSYSSIIKLHNLRSQRIVVGTEPSGRRSPILPLRELEGDSEANQYGTGGPREISDGRQVPSRMADARQIVRQARSEADAILGQATGKAEAVRLQAYEEGFQSGRAEGLASARKEAEEDIHRIAGLAGNVAADMSRVLVNSEEGIIKLALSIAEKIVQKTLSEDRGTIASMVRWALEQMDTMEVLRLRVNPDDLEVLRPFWEDGQSIPGSNKIELASDPHVQAGGCIIDTNNSVIDAQIKTKLAEIEMAFREQLNASDR